MHFRGCTFCLKLLAALLLLGIAQAAATSQALASCGDWLVDHASPGANFAASQRILLEQPLEPQPRPCDGPQCRRAPAPPLPTAPVRLLLDSKDCCCMLEGTAAAMRNRVAFHPLQDEPLPDSLTKPRIERPPRS